MSWSPVPTTCPTTISIHDEGGRWTQHGNFSQKQLEVIPLNPVIPYSWALGGSHNEPWLGRKTLNPLQSQFFPKPGLAFCRKDSVSSCSWKECCHHSATMTFLFEAYVNTLEWGQQLQLPTFTQNHDYHGGTRLTCAFLGMEIGSETHIDHIDT